MIYIQKQIRFWDVDEVLPDSYITGETIEDYNNGAFLLLNDDQVAFHEANPNASMIEVWNMELIPVPDPYVPEVNVLEETRKAKLQEIISQDELSNKFYVLVTQGGVELSNQELWIDKDTRNSLYSITLPALQSDGETTTRLWTSSTPPQSIEVPISWAMEKLPLLEIYAKRTYDLRASNEAAVYAATTVEELQSIDVRANYPAYLTFELNLDLRNEAQV